MSFIKHNTPFPLSRRAAQIDSSAIRLIFDLGQKLQQSINLSIGQPHFSTPMEIREAAAKAIIDGKTAYTQTQGILSLREALANKYVKQNGFIAHPDNILVSSGVSSLIQLLFLATLEPKDRILLTDPTFLIYLSLGRFFHAEMDLIPENFTVDDIERLDIRNLKMIIISNPSNPTGHIYSKRQLEMLIQLAEKSNALLVCDEIYELYDYDQRFQSLAKLYPRTLTLSGFSKSYSMTGLRLAAATGPSKVILAMTTIQQYTVVCAPTPVQYAGLKALELDMKSYIAEYKKNRDYCLEQLKNRPELEYTYPAGAFYIFLKVPERDEQFVKRAIQEKQLLVVPGHIFSQSQNHIRLSYSVEKTTLIQGMNALQQLL